MTEPRPKVVIDMFRLALMHGCTDAELRDAVDLVTQRPKRGPPRSKTYGRLLSAMFALIGIYRGDHFTAANLVLRLADGPIRQRENQARALVRRFDEEFNEESLSKTQELYAGYGAGMRVAEFYAYWRWSGLPEPPGIKSATDWESELAALAMASKGSIDAATREYIVALDQSLVRAAIITPERRAEIAQKAATTRRNRPR